MSLYINTVPGLATLSTLGINELSNARSITVQKLINISANICNQIIKLLNNNNDFSNGYNHNNITIINIIKFLNDDNDSNNGHNHNNWP